MKGIDVLPPALDPIGSLRAELTCCTLELPNLHVNVFSDAPKLGTVNTGIEVLMYIGTTTWGV